MADSFTFEVPEIPKGKETKMDEKVTDAIRVPTDFIPRGSIMDGTPTSAIKVNVTILGDPVSKQRPKFTRNKNGTVYTPKKTVDAELGIKWEIKKAHRELIPDGDQQFSVWLEFYTKSNQRRDIDNMCKLVFDACNNLVWVDDAQVRELHAYLDRADPNPRTVIKIAGTGLSHNNLIKCKVCKKLFKTYPSWPYRKCCSAECSNLLARNGIDTPCLNCGIIVHRPLNLANKGFGIYCSMECKHLHMSILLTCDNCGREFRKPKSQVRSNGRRFCSEKCQIDKYRILRAKNAVGVCSKCGGPTTKKEYLMCRACRVESGKFRNNLSSARA